MEIKAESKHVRVSPRKLRLLVKSIAGLSLNDALLQLKFMYKSGASDLVKTLESAKANATNNFKLKTDDLMIKSIVINEAGAMKRWNPVSRGMAHSYKKRMSHIKVVLNTKGEKNGTKS